MANNGIQWWNQQNTTKLKWLSLLFIDGAMNMLDASYNGPILISFMMIYDGPTEDGWYSKHYKLKGYSYICKPILKPRGEVYAPFDADAVIFNLNVGWILVEPNYRNIVDSSEAIDKYTRLFIKILILF